MRARVVVWRPLLPYASRPRPTRTSRLGRERVQQRALADAAVADEDRGLAGDAAARSSSIPSPVRAEQSTIGTPSPRYGASSAELRIAPASRPVARSTLLTASARRDAAVGERDQEAVDQAGRRAAACAARRPPPRGRGWRPAPARGGRGRDRGATAGWCAAGSARPPARPPGRRREPDPVADRELALLRRARAPWAGGRGGSRRPRARPRTGRG